MSLAYSQGWLATGKLNMTYNNALRKSTLREELEWRYLEKKITPFVLVGIVSWLAFMWMILNGIVATAGEKIVIFN